MNYNRIILHSDLNSYFASVELLKNPSLVSLPVAVCGNTEERHGIVLAKNTVAKKLGVITGEPVVSARAKCPFLNILPPHYDDYIKYSRMTRDIYARYTDMIEPFGIDECWLDVTESTSMFGSGAEIAEKIRASVEAELGLTVSVGVSFTKSFAKIGSDLKKPNAVTCLPYESFREDVWRLPVEMLIGIGRATLRRLYLYSIHTIGELAATPVDSLKLWFGKTGVVMWMLANGLDSSPVTKDGYCAPVKSVGHGITTTSDLQNPEEAFEIITELAQTVGYRLRRLGLAAKGAAVSVRDNTLEWREFQGRFSAPEQRTRIIAERACELFSKNYAWGAPVRSVAVRVIDLIPDDAPRQLDIFDVYGGDEERRAREAELYRTLDALRERYGEEAVCPAVHFKGMKMLQRRPSIETPLSLRMNVH